MWRQNQLIFLILSASVTGSCWTHLKVVVSPEVAASRGEDAVLGCSFTYSGQQQYSGTIAVGWLARAADSSPFFSCSVRNSSAAQGLADCSSPQLKHSLTGDPRRGELSLLVRDVQLTDSGQYFCRVELDGHRPASGRTQLRVTAEPQILSLSVAKTSDSAPRRLQCQVEGHPLPKLVWLSASKLKLVDQGATTSMGRFRLMGVVPYPEEEEVTCRAESELGGAQRTYPTRQSPMIKLVVCGLVGALLLLLLFIVVIVHCRRNRAPVDTPPGHEDAVDGHGDSDIQLVYSVLGAPPVPQLLSSCCPPEPGVLYSPVNVQH